MQRIRLRSTLRSIWHRRETRQWIVAAGLAVMTAPAYAQAAFNPFEWICAAMEVIKGPLAAAGFLIAAAVFLIMLMASEHRQGVTTFLLIGLCVTALLGIDQLGKTFWPKLSFLC